MERKIGEVFQDGEMTLKCVESKGCNKCYYEPSFFDEKCKTMNCSKHQSSDKKERIFIKQY